jgi:5'-deoxynucleotidase YfbR-like HD superfamily hydrolase
MSRFKNAYQTKEYKDKSDFIKLLHANRKLKNCNRLSGFSLIQTYSVAEHCYYTGILFETIADELMISITDAEREYVYRHDIIESITGDMLRPVKNFNIHVKDCWKRIEQELLMAEEFIFLHAYRDHPHYFEDETWRLFKICDVLELLLFIKEESKLGSKNMELQIIADNCKDYIFKNCDKEWKQLLETIIHEY